MLNLKVIVKSTLNMYFFRILQLLLQDKSYLPLDTSLDVQNDEAAARMIQRRRRRDNPHRPEPNTAADIPYPLNIATATNENFCFYDSGAQDPNRFIIFTSPGNLLKLNAQGNHIAMDAIFKVFPKQFYQLLVIHAVLPARNSSLLKYILVDRKISSDA